MILSESFSVLPQNEPISVGRTLSLSLWPISTTPLRSSLRSLTYNVLSNTNDLNKISVLAVFSLTPLKTREVPPINNTKRFPTAEFKNAFLTDGFSQPVNLSNNRGFAFFLNGTESDALSRARCLSFEKVIDERMIDGNTYTRIEIGDLFELFPILTQFSLRFPLKPPPLTATSFCPIIRLTPYRERINAKQNKINSVQFTVFKADSSKNESSISLDCSKSEKLDRWSNHLSPIIGTLIYISGEKIAHNRQLLKDNGITHIINCASHLISTCGDHLKDSQTSSSDDDEDIANDDFVVLRLPMSDGGDESIFSWIFKATSFIKNALSDNHNKILIHCIQGSSRSASIVIGYLILTRKYDYDKAYQIVREKRRIASPHPKFMAQLIQLSEIVGGRDQKTSIFFKQKEIKFYLTTKKYVSHIGQNDTGKDKSHEQNNDKNFKYSLVMKPKCKPNEGYDAKCFVTIDFKNVGDDGLYKLDQTRYKSHGVVIIESPESVDEEKIKKDQDQNENENEEEEEEYEESPKVTKKELNFVLNFADEIEDCLRVIVNRTYRAYKAPNWDTLDADFSFDNHDKGAVYVLVDLLGAKLFVGKKVDKKSTNFDSIINSFCKANHFDKSLFKIVFENQNDEEFLTNDYEEEEEEYFD